jgi:hypothetical protein
MTIIKRIALGILLIIIISVIGYISFPKYEEYKIRHLINNNKVVIDQETHEWDAEKTILIINMHIRNTTHVFINGNMIFNISLDENGLDSSYVKNVIEYYGKKLILDYEGIRSPRYDAILSYIKRGDQFEEGKNYEPIVGEKITEHYSIDFRKYISIRPNELIKIVHHQDIPPQKGGYLSTIKIKGIEFD